MALLAFILALTALGFAGARHGVDTRDGFDRPPSSR